MKDKKLYKYGSIIDYPKIQISNKQLLETSHKPIIIFFWQNKLGAFHEEKKCRHGILSDKTVKDRGHLIICLPFDPEVVVEYLFLYSILFFYRKNKIDSTKPTLISQKTIAKIFFG